MENLEELKDILEEEIKKITQKGSITPTELDSMTKAVCLIEKINMIEDYDNSEDYDDENSYYSRRRNYNYDSYNDGGRSMSRSNRNSDYSGHSIKDRMIDRLESMMDEAKSEYERKIVSDWINRLDSE